jgi:hypothetical protein
MHVVNSYSKLQEFLMGHYYGKGTKLKKIKFVEFFLALVSFAGLCYPADTTITLTASDAKGFLSIVNVNNEAVEPNSSVAKSKDFDYPYYFDSTLGASGLWVMVVAEKLSAQSRYVQETEGMTIKNKTVTDEGFADGVLGTITYDGALVGPSGKSTIAPDAFVLTLSADDYSPLNKPRNVNNEFAWTYQITPSNIAGTGLTFTDGVLSRIDITADIKVDVLFMGAPQGRFNPGFSQVAALEVSENRFAFSFDVTEAQTTLLGPMENARVELNRTGTIDAVTPVYTVTVLSGGNGTTTPSGEVAVTAKEGDSVTVTATPANGFIFTGWTVLEGAENIAISDSTSDTAVVTVNSDAVIQANFDAATSLVRRRGDVPRDFGVTIANGALTYAVAQGYTGPVTITVFDSRGRRLFAHDAGVKRPGRYVIAANSFTPRARHGMCVFVLRAGTDQRFVKHLVLK